MRNHLFFLFLFTTGVATAQQNTKLDGQLKLWLSEPTALYQNHKEFYKTGPIADPVIDIIFKTTGGNPSALVTKHNGKLHSMIGNICTAELPLSHIQAFANDPMILKIESAKEMKLTNDKARQLIGADKVQSDSLPSGQSYTGKGVLVGIVDSGIDFLHPDFRKKDDATQTRIASMWDQTALVGVKPSGFTYGAEWTQAQVNAELTTPGTVTLRDSMGHGTHVSGSAAGLRGVAYDAEIIMVKTPLSSNGDYKFSNSSRTLDAVNYIYQKAAALGKPCVVNMSLGFAFGAPHDGTSLFEQGLDNLVTNGNSFIVCASAGNDGASYSHHGGYKLTADSVWTYVNGLNGATWYQVNNQQYDDSIYISVVADTAHFNGGIGSQGKLFQTPWLKVKDVKDAAGGFMYPILNSNGDTSATIRIVATSYDNDRTELYVYPRDRFMVDLSQQPAKINLYKICFKGAGSIHAWVEPLYNLGVNVQSFNGHTDVRYKASDNIYTIGIPGTAKKVITVGAFINKKNYIDILGRTQQGLNTGGQNPGTIAFFSSIGPTLDGRVKPEFCAPGLNVASSLSRYAKKDSTEMVDANTIVFSGTSMSCPVTVGALALYFEQNPQATYDQLRAAIDSSTLRDAYVKTRGPVPNNTWGFGKLDIFNAMKSIATGIDDVDVLSEGQIQVFPNPANSKISFRFAEPLQSASLSVYDINGKLVHASPITADQIDVQVSEWKTGIYFYRINKADASCSGKFIVE